MHRRTTHPAITFALLVTVLAGVVAAAAGPLRQPTGVFVQADGTLLIADREHNQVHGLDPWGGFTTLAGTGSSGSVGDGGPATAAELRRPEAVAADASGAIYVCDTSNSRVRRIGPDGTIDRVAGSFLRGFGGDGGQATSAPLYYPRGVHVGPDGSLYIADTGNHRVRRVDTEGVISTVAGNGSVGFEGDGGAATTAALNGPTAVFVDVDGSLYIADTGNHRVRRVGTDGTIVTVAGSGTAGDAGDGGLAEAAQLDAPRGLYVDRTGALFIADSGNHKVRRVAAGTIATVAGTGAAGLAGDLGPATAAQLNTPTDVYGAAGELFVADSGNDRIRRITGDGTIVSVAGSVPPVVRNQGATVAEGGAVVLTAAMLEVTDADSPPQDVRILLGAAPINGTLYLDDSALMPGDVFAQPDIDAGRVRYEHNDSETANDTFTFTVTDQTNWLPGATFAITVQPVADGDEFTVDGGTGVDHHEGGIYYVERLRNKVTRIGLDGVLQAVAGTGTPGALGDGGSAASAELRRPYDVYAAPTGELYIADTGNNRIRRIDAAGTIETFAGAYLKGFGGDGGPALAANFDAPRGITGDAAGNLYVADTGNHRVRRIDPQGIVTTIAGNGISGFGGDGGAATAASLNTPVDLFAGADGNLYVADTGNHRVRRIDPQGTITTVAGNGISGFGGDGGAATAASLSSPVAVHAGADGSLTIADAGNGRVRHVDAAGTIQTVVGNGVDTAENDGGFAVDAGIGTPVGLDVDDAGRLWLADTESHRVRWVEADATIHTLWPNVPPVLAANSGLTLPEGTTAVLSAQQLRTDDADDDPAALIYTLVSAPVTGQLQRDGLPLTVTQTFTQADVDAGRVAYAHSGDNTVHDSFGFIVEDDRVALAGATFEITILPVNDEPVADAGADQELMAPGRFIYVLLDGGGSHDPDGGNELTYTWRIDGQVVAQGDRSHAEMPWVVVEAGTHVAQLEVRDASGTWATDEAVITVRTDATAPQIAVAEPAPAMVVRSGRVRLEGSVVEDVVLQSLRVDGRQRPFLGHAPQYFFSFDVNLPEEGANQIVIEAADVTGNMGTAILSVVRDTADPVVTVVEPAPGTQLTGDAPQVWVRGTVVDAGAGVAEVSVNGAAAHVDGDAFEALVDLGGEGARTLTVRAVDAVGNAVTERVEIQVDTRAPRLEVATPIDRSVVESATVLVTGTASDAGTGIASLTVDGAAVDVVDGAFGHELTLADGAHEIAVVATDGAGRTSTRSLRVDVRSEPVAAPTVATRILGSDGSPVAEVRVDLLREDGRGAGQRQFTGEDGRASFLVEPEAVHRLRVRWLNGEVVTDALQAGADAELQLQATSLRLIESEGAPLAEVRVDLKQGDGGGTGTWSRTGADGVVAFDVLPGFEHRFEVRMDRGTHTTAPSVGGGTQALATVRSVLQLTTSDGAALSGTRVDLLQADGSGTGARIDTDENGIAAFELLPEIVHRFQVRHAGGTLTTAPRAGAGADTVRTVPSTLVLTDVDGAPLAGARVDLRQADGSGTGLRADTDAQGVAAFELLPGQAQRFEVTYNRGSYLTEVWTSPAQVALAAVRSTLTLLDHDGQPLADSRVDLLHDNGAGAGERTTTTADGVAGFDLLPGDVHGFRVTLNGGTYVAGPLGADEDVTVRTHLSQLALADADGQPVVGARVTLLRADSSSTGQRADTDAQGRAGFEVLPDQHVRFQIAHNGGSFVTDMVPAGQLTTLTLGLAADRVELVLTDSDGQPLSGARVDLLRENGRGAGERVDTDAAGLAAFTVVPGARHQLRVYLQGTTLTTAVVDAGSRTSVQTLASRLQLTNSAGAPLAGVRVDLLRADGKGAGSRTETDSSGVAAFELLPGQTHAFGVSYSGAQLQTSTFAAGASVAVQTLSSRLQLTDSAGAPLAGVRVDLLRADGKGAGSRSETDASGVAAFELLPGQTHAFRVRHSGAQLQTSTFAAGASVAVQTERTELTLRSAGAPVAEARVVLLKEDGAGAGVSARTDADGRAGFEVLPGMVHAMRARVDGAWHVTEDLNGASTVVLDVAGPAAKTLAGAWPTATRLEAAYPNPFNPATTLRFSLAAPQEVRLAVYNTLGQQVRLLAEGERAAGTHAVTWDGRDAYGRQAASGTYLYVLETGARRFTGQVTYLR